MRAVKAAHPDLGVVCDVALDPFTTHGHDGLFDDDKVLNDETIAVYVNKPFIRPMPAVIS